MITVIADPHTYREPPPEALKASGPRDYVPARMAIRRALNLGEALVVHVTDRLLLYWLEDLADYDGVHWEVVAPEADFRRLFGVDPAPPFTTELLIALDVAAMSAPPAGVELDPAGWVLGERVHLLWAVATANTAHLGQLLTWSLKHGNALAPTLLPLVQQRLSTWAGVDSAYSSLRSGSLAADATNLIRRAAFRHYDVSWLRAHGLAELPLVTPTLSGDVWTGALRGLAPAIERYWREKIAGTTPDKAFVQAAVASMSGWSDSELRAIEGVLVRNPDLLDQPLIYALRQRFQLLPEAAASLDALEALLPPARPELPQGDWSDQQWLRWATDTYMPYFAWTVRSQQPRDHQEACALAFETWLAGRYPVWLTSTGSPLITGQFTLLRDLLDAQPNAVVVWLVIDGLTWWQGRMLHEIVRHHGLHPQRSEAGVAMLPSLTDISKRALVTGLPITEPPRDTIAQAASEKLRRLGVRAHVGYDERDVLEAVRSPEPPQCVLWFANMLDRLAHDRQTFADDSVVRGYLEELVRTVGRIQGLCVERGRPFHVLVGSDHGSTLLPPTAPSRKVPQAAHEVVDVWEDGGEQRGAAPVSARAVQVSDAPRLQLERPDEWHYLDHLRYQLPQDYLVPKGYAAVGRRPGGWTHGGLTPEETIVPLLHLAPEPLIVQNLNLTLSGRVQPRKEGTLAFVLVNPNPAPLEAAVLRIADLPPLVIDSVAAGGRYECTVHLPARPIEGKELSLSWMLEGSVLGVEHRQQGEARIAVRRLQTDDAFGEMFG